MKNKKVLLMGGVGNRLFQIARAQDLIDLGYTVDVVDIEDLKLLSFLAYRFLAWSRHGSWLDIDELCSEIGVERKKPKLADGLGFGLEIFKMRILGQKQLYNSELLKDRRKYQVGYFQNAESITQNSVLKLARALQKGLMNRVAADESAVVHIRAGDFSTSDRVDPELVSAFWSAVQGRCTCVTNDKGFVRESYPFLKFSESDSVQDDFAAIASAKTILPSNSTFCFWACVIAVKLYGARLYWVPEDSYWQHLAEPKV